MSTHYANIVSMRSARKQLQTIYRRLFDAYGPQRWWPAEEPFEVMVGAVLTQSAAWTNVEKAIASLKAAKALSPAALREIDAVVLGGIIHSCGYFNVKARKLKALAEWFGERYQDDIRKMRAIETERLRQELLGVWGVGEETADSIILYAAEQPIFVIDAYTKRIIDRLGLAPERNSYAAYQSLFMDNLPADSRLFNEYHALLVALGKNVCRKQPLCSECCLRQTCSAAVTPFPGSNVPKS